MNVAVITLNVMRFRLYHLFILAFTLAIALVAVDQYAWYMTSRNWEHKSVTVLTTNESKKQVDVSVTQIPFEDGYSKHFTAFVTPTGGTWVGPRQQYYIEHGPVISGFNKILCYIRWCESIDLESLPTPESTDRLVSQLYKKITPSSRQQALSACNRKLVSTDLRFCFSDSDFFFRGSQHAVTKIVAAKVEDGNIRLDIVSETANRKGTVWIDPESKQVIKAFENGEQTYSFGEQNRLSEEFNEHPNLKGTVWNFNEEK